MNLKFKVSITFGISPESNKSHDKNMDYKELIKEGQIRQQKEKEQLKQCQPPRLSIDKLGWKSFLTQWNDEYMRAFIKTRLEFGWYSTYVAHTKKERQALLQEYGLDDSYLEIFEGGLSASENTSDAKIKERLEKIKTFSAAALQAAEKSRSKYTQELIEQGQNEAKAGKFSFIAEAGEKFTRLDYGFDIDDAIIVNGGLFQKPATKAAIEQVEARLQQKTPLSVFGPGDIYINEARSLLEGKQFSMPKSYREFLEISNGWLMTIAPLSARGYFNLYNGQVILPIEQLTYFATDYNAQYLFNDEIWERADDGEYKRIPTSILIATRTYYSRIVTLFDIAKAREDGEFEVYSLDTITSPVMVEVYPNFKRYMETQYVYSIADVRCEYSSLQEMRKTGEWKPLNQR